MAGPSKKGTPLGKRVHFFTPVALRLSTLVYDSEEPLPKEFVVFEAGLAIPPSAAHRRYLEELQQNRRTRGTDEDYPIITQDLVDAGRRRLTLIAYRRLIALGRFIEFEDDEGRMMVTRGPHPFEPGYLEVQVLHSKDGTAPIGHALTAGTDR